MKICITLLFLSITSFIGIAQADPNKEQELQDILRKHTDAMGGLRNWNKVESIRTTGTIERNGQLVDFCIIKKRPNQIRATITMPIPGREDEFLQIIRAHDGKEAWTATRIAGGDTLAHQALTGDEAESLIEEAQVLPQLIHLWQSSAKLELVGVKTIRSELHHIIRAQQKSNPYKSYEFYVSDESYLASKTITYKDSEITSTSTSSDLESISGITVAKTLRLSSPVTGDSLMQVQDVTIGVGIYEEYFESMRDTQATLLNQ